MEMRMKTLAQKIAAEWKDYRAEAEGVTVDKVIGRLLDSIK